MQDIQDFEATVDLQAMANILERFDENDEITFSFDSDSDFKITKNSTTVWVLNDMNLSKISIIQDMNELDYTSMDYIAFTDACNDVLAITHDGDDVLLKSTNHLEISCHVATGYCERVLHIGNGQMQKTSDVLKIKAKYISMINSTFCNVGETLKLHINNDSIAIVSSEIGIYKFVMMISTVYI
jgi:hypothetical protein